jgi:hypothetical protein
MKHLFLLIAFIFLTLTANSQSFRYGIKGGANYADINGKDLDKNAHRYRLSWHGGALLNIQYPGTRWFSIQPEILYSSKGYENYSLPFEFTDNKGVVLYSAQRGGFVRFNYVEIPVMLNFRSGIIIFEFGPQFSVLTSYRNDAVIRQTFADGTIITANDDIRRFDKDRLNKIDVGLATGFRLETSNGVGLGLRFNQGFIKLDNGEPAAFLEPQAPDGSNQIFQLFVSYLIPE